MGLLTQARAHDLPVDRFAIQSFGRKAKASLVAQASTPTECERLGGFTASEGRAKKFVGRECLKSRKLHDQAGSVDDEAIADALRKVSETIAKYDPECIVNCDETALQYKLLPRFTYTAADEDKSSVRGVKDMGAKERVTLYVATDASGRKLPLEMIGHSKGPRCFRVRKPPSSTSARPTRGLTRASSACGGRMCFFREYVQSPANPFSSSWTTTAATPTWSSPVGR